MKFELEVNGIVVGKQRPRTAVINGRARIYTQAETRRYENRIQHEFVEKYYDQHFEANEPIRCDILIGIQIPMSFSKKKHQAALNKEILPLTKPDLDNSAKSLMDALTSIAYHDDKQIVVLVVKKIYAPMPFVRMRLQTATKEDCE